VKADQVQSHIRFAEFSADLATGEVYRGAERLVLQSKPFRILELLLRSAGSYVNRERIQQELWPNVHVDGQRCLNTAVRKLRKALGDNAAHSRLIETETPRAIANRTHLTICCPGHHAP
jgi:DNA-binding response OmpR family regulator